MKRETVIWLVILLVGVGLLVVKGAVSGLGRVYVQDQERSFVEVIVPPPIGADPTEQPQQEWVPLTEAEARGLERVAGSPTISWVQDNAIAPKEYWAARQQSPPQTDVRLSISRTIGLWVAAFFTLAIFSFLYRDNPFYKIAEACVVGVSAAYWMVVGFWDVIIPNLVGNLNPNWARWAMPDLPEVTPLDQGLAVVPLILGIMLIWRLSPVGSWIARWPLAFVIGTTAGLRLIAFLHANFLAQIRNTILPLAVRDAATGAFEFWPSFNNVLLVLAVMACLVYFFFSYEHKGVVGGVARLGIWVLMITFGAGFGFTVMGRIALLAIRLEFLMDNWLWLIDPTNVRTVSAMAGG